MTAEDDRVAVEAESKAKLNLSGNMKAHTKQPAYVLSVPAQAGPLQGNVWVADNQSRHLQPGHYGDVTVNAGSSLTMEPGTYTFLKLSVAPPAPNAGPILAQSDLDKDQQVTLVEYRTAKLANFDRMDADKDGVVSVAEMRAGGLAK